MALLRRQSDKADVIASIPLFGGLTKREVSEIAKLVDEMDVAEGTTLATQGEVARQVVVILSGSAVVRRSGRKVAEVGPGDIVGEIGLVTHRPRNATVVTATPATILVLSGQAFDKVMQELPSVARKVLQTVADRLAEATSTH